MKNDIELLYEKIDYQICENDESKIGFRFDSVLKLSFEKFKSDDPHALYLNINLTLNLAQRSKTLKTVCVSFIEC